MPPPDTGLGQRGDFYRVITAAVADFSRQGFVSQAQLEDWMEAIRASALRSLMPLDVVEDEVNRLLRSVFQREVESGRILKRHAGVGSFGLHRVKPKLHAELDRRLMANRSLIRLNRAKAIETTVQRFAGWASSIPAGGSDVVEKNPVKTNIRKALAQLPFEERRVAIDQGHKMVAVLNDIIANDNGALAMVWHSMWRQRGYDYRDTHKARDLKVYAIRGNWALNRGLMKAGPAGYTDQITAPAEEVGCQCTGQYLYSLDRLPDDMVTQKGREESARVDEVIRRRAA